MTGSTACRRTPKPALVAFALGAGLLFAPPAAADDIKRVSANGTELAYVEAGRGEPVRTFTQLDQHGDRPLREPGTAPGFACDPANQVAVHRARKLPLRDREEQYARGASGSRLIGQGFPVHREVPGDRRRPAAQQARYDFRRNAGRRHASARSASDRQALAPLRPARIEHLAPPEGFHSRPETMGPGAPDLRRLIGPLHLESLRES